MFSNIIKIVSAVLLMLLFTGCINRIGDFTIASTKNINIKSETFKVDTSHRTEGSDTIYIIVFIPTGTANMKDAMDKAIDNAPNAVGLTNVTVKQGFWWIPFIYGQEWYTVEGNPIYENTAQDISNYEILTVTQ